MEFPNEAVYGPHHTPDSLSGWNGRDEYEDVVRMASRESRDEDAAGGPGGSFDGIGGVEVTRIVALPIASAPGQSSPRGSPEGLRATGSLLSPEDDGAADDGDGRGDQASLSPHVDTTAPHGEKGGQRLPPPLSPTQQPLPALSPCSTGTAGSSLAVELSDLEHSLNDEVSTVKDWLGRVKSERDRLRKEKASLTIRLTDERRGRDADVARLEAEMASARSEGEEAVEGLMKELHASKVQRAEEKAAADLAAKTVEEAHAKELEEQRGALTRSFEEALAEERDAAAAREAQAKKDHLANLAASIAELQGKFERDLAEIRESRDDALEEEREAHSKTAEELRTTKVERDAEREAAEKKLEDARERLVAEQERFAGLLEEGVGSVREELEVVTAELAAANAERDERNQACEEARRDLEAASAAREEQASRLEVHAARIVELRSELDDRTREREEAEGRARELSEAVEATEAERDGARSDLRTAREENEALSAARDAAQEEVTRLNEEASRSRAEADALREARGRLEAREGESKAEIKRLQGRLEEAIASLRECRSSDGSSHAGSSGGGGSDGGSCHIGEILMGDKDDGSGEAGVDKSLAVPSLVDRAVDAEDAEVARGADRPSESSAVRERLRSAEKERDAFRAEVDRTRRERDSLRRMVDALASSSGGRGGGGGGTAGKETTEEVAELRSELTKAEAARAATKATNERLEGEVADLKGKLEGAEREEDSEVKSQLAEAEAAHAATKATNERLEKEVADLKGKLAGAVEEVASTEVKSKLAKAEVAYAATKATNERLEKEVADLKAKLDETEATFAVAEAEHSEELKGSQRARDELAAEVKKLKASLLLRDIGAASDEERRDRRREEEEAVERASRGLQGVLDAQVENERLAAELEESRARAAEEARSLREEKERLASELAATATATKGEEDGEAVRLREHLDAQMEINEKLVSELTVLRAAADVDGGSVNDDDRVAATMVRVAKDIEEMKAEHRIEVKLLKEEHASIKTKAKLLVKERDELAGAYEMERTSNTDLETSLEELVALLQAEREVLGERTKALKSAKKKCSNLRKKRVPMDAAHKASLTRIEKLEGEVELAQKRSDNYGQELCKVIKLIEGLSLILDERDGSETSPDKQGGSGPSSASISASSLSKNKQLEELTSKCELLGARIHDTKLALESERSSRKEDNDNSREQIDRLGKDNGEMRDQIEQLTKAALMRHKYIKENEELKRRIDELTSATPPAKSCEDTRSQTQSRSLEDTGAQTARVPEDPALGALRKENEALKCEAEHAVDRSELETSLSELVKLLHNERAVHLEETAKLSKEVQTIEEKCNGLRKERDDAEAAHEASRGKIEQMEGREVAAATGAIRWVEGLTRLVLEGESSDLESPLASVLEGLSSEIVQIRELAEKCWALEAKVRAAKEETASQRDGHREATGTPQENIKLKKDDSKLNRDNIEPTEDNDEVKERADPLARSVPPSKPSEDSRSQTNPAHDPLLDTLRAENQTLREKSKHLVRELVDSTKAFGELAGRCRTLEGEVLAAKNEMTSERDAHHKESGELKQKIDHLTREASEDNTVLKEENNELKGRVIQLEKAIPLTKSSKVSSSQTGRVHDPEVDALREANHTLKDKSKHLAKELADSTQAFENTITSYESVIAKVRNALSEKKQENEELKDELKELKELAGGTKAAEEASASYQPTIDEVKNILSEKERENAGLQKDLDEAKSALDNLEAKMKEESIGNGKTTSKLENRQVETIDQFNEKLSVYQEAVDVLKQKLLDGDAAAEEAIAAYESIIDEVKKSLSEKVQENEALQKNLKKAERALANLTAKMEEDTIENGNTIAELEMLQSQALDRHKEKLKTYKETVSDLKQKLEDRDVAVRTLKKDKTKLSEEVARLQEDFAAVISEFEQELGEAGEEALRGAREECEAAKATLREKEEEYDLLASELAERKDNERESAKKLLDSETTIHDLRSELSEIECEKIDLMNKIASLTDHISDEAGHGEKLIDENTQQEAIIHGLREELSANKSEKKELEASKSKLIEKIASLTDVLSQLTKDSEGYLTEIELLKSQLMQSVDEKTHQEETLEELRKELSTKQAKIEDNMEIQYQLQSECTKLKEDCTRLTEEKEMAEQMLEVADDEKKHLSSQLEDKSTKLSDVRQKIDENKSRHRKELDDMMKQVKNMSELVDIAAGHRDKAQNELKEVSSTVKELSQTNHDTQMELGNLKEEVQKRQREIDVLSEERDELAGKNVSLMRENTEVQAQMQQSKQAAGFTENQLSSLRKEVSVTEERRKEAVLATEAAEEERREAIRAVETAKEEVRNVTSKLDATETELAKTIAKLDDLLNYNARLKADHERTTSSHKIEMDEQMKSMNEVIQSLQNQVKTIETDKEENRKMYEKDVSLQQAEVDALKLKHTEAQKNLTSLTELVANLKAALESEKENAQILLQQFKQSEIDRKSYQKQKEELEAELASRLQTETGMAERIRRLEEVENEREQKLEGTEKELASRMKSEAIMKERIRYLETELQELRSVAQQKEDEINELRASMMEIENAHNTELAEMKSKIGQDQKKYLTMQERISSMESHTKSLQEEFKHTLHEKEKEGAKLRVVLQEAKDKLGRMWDDNSELKNRNSESMQSLQHMLNDAIRSRANTDKSLQESLQLLEQQKRIDIKRKGEISKLEQTVEILKSKERYLESYVASLKKQIRRG